MREMFWSNFRWTSLLRRLAVGIIGIGISIPFENTEGGSLRRPDRQWLVRLQQAEQKIAQGRIAEASPLLEQILSSGQRGYASVEAEGGLHLPLARAAALLLESLPPEAQATWEAWCAGKATRELDEALLQRDREALRRVVEQYPATRFAAEAALVLAADAFDRRQWLEAIRWTERVLPMAASTPAMKQQACLLAGAAQLRRDQAEQARLCFDQLLALGPLGQLRLAEQPLPANVTVDRLMELLRPRPDRQQIGGKEPPTGLLTGWPMFRGAPDRNASAPWTGPVGQLRWRLEMEGVEEFSGKPFDGVRGLRFFVPGELPSSQPILIEELALVRLPTRLVAVDLWTGKQKWEFPPGGDPTMREQVQGMRVLAQDMVIRHLSPQAQLTRERIFEDAPYGQMVVQGHRLFLLEDMSLPRSMLLPVLMGMELGTAKPSVPLQQNRLIALDLRKEGKVLWSIGGVSGEDEPALAGAFFLGPPLPVEGVLFVLAEQAEEIRLLALNETTGQLLWSLPIATLERPILRDPQRRLAGAMPSYADGVLVCPTSASAVVAVDPWTRTVLWAYEIPLAESTPSNRRIKQLAFAVVQSYQPDTYHFSYDSTATIAEGYVLVAPVESDQLFCLELATGRLCWQRNLEDFRYVAAAAEEVVLAVGRRSVSGWRLRSGKPAWEELTLPLPEGFTTAGRGFRQGGRYWLPIGKGEESALLGIDISTGRFEDRLLLPTKTRIGNVAAAGQTLLFFSPEGVEAFGPEKP